MVGLTISGGTDCFDHQSILAHKPIPCVGKT